MNKKWLILITILMLAGVLVSGCTDSQSEDTTEAQTEETVEEQTEVEAEEEEVTVGEPEEYAVRMEYYGFVPAEMEIRKGDIIAWRNYNKQKVYTLVSDDGLFDDQEMKFGNMYNHMFDEKGTYTFSVKDVPDMTLTVTVV